MDQNIDLSWKVYAADSSSDEELEVRIIKSNHINFVYCDQEQITVKGNVQRDLKGV